MPCEPNYPAAFSGDCVATLLSVVTGGAGGWEAADAAYNLIGYLIGAAKPDNRLALTEVPELRQLLAAMEAQPQPLLFDRFRSGGGADPAAATGGFDWSAVLQFLLPMLLNLLKSRLGGG